jgi:Protein of unknown function (DUF3467)
MPKHQLEVRYSNYFRVGHNPFEFLLDFCQAHDDDKEPQAHTSIVTGPVHAKAFLDVLRTAVEQYEQAFGVIEDHRS